MTIFIIDMISTCTSQPFVEGLPAVPSSPPAAEGSSEIRSEILILVYIYIY